MKSGKTLKIAQILLYLNAAIWVALAVTSLIRLEKNDTLPLITLLVISFLMFCNAGAMFIAGVTIVRGKRWYLYFAIAVLVVNIILTFTDQVGIFDWLTLIIDIFILGLILI